MSLPNPDAILKQGGDKLFELIKKKIIEANPDSALLNWDDFSSFLDASFDYEHDNKMTVVLAVKPDAKNKYSWIKSLNQSNYPNHVGVQRFNINAIHADELFEQVLEQTSTEAYVEYKDIEEYKKALRFFINNRIGFTIDPEDIDPDSLTDIYIRSRCDINIDFTPVEIMPEYAKGEIPYYNDLVGIDGDRKSYIVNGVYG